MVDTEFRCWLLIARQITSRLIRSSYSNKEKKKNKKIRSSHARVHNPCSLAVSFVHFLLKIIIMESSKSRCQRFRARIIQSSCHVILFFFFPLFIFYLSCFFVVGWGARCCVVVVVVRNNRIECQSLRGTTSPGPAHAGSYHLFLSSLDFYPKPIHPSWPPTQDMK
jgi:hypothetical protein